VTRVLVTGADGFLGRNLSARLSAVGGLQLTGVDVQTPKAKLDEALQQCDIVFHFAGVNRSKDPDDFRKVNRDFTRQLCRKLIDWRRSPRIIFSSSIQAVLNNSYGISKREAEDVLLQYAAETGAVVRIYRLKNLFGKWARPEHNSVVATFCYNTAHDLPIWVSDPKTQVALLYVDDVVDAFLREIGPTATAVTGLVDTEMLPAQSLALGELAGTIQSFREMRETLLLPNFAMPFHRELYATYLSYVPETARETRLQAKRDSRGALAEFLKSKEAGQIFLSRTLPGIVRGNHYHHTKTEKFFVVEGDGLLRMRQIQSREIVEYWLCGRDYQVVDIPPGYTHSIQNVGSREMVTLFWASEIFNPDRPDTYYLPVDEPQQAFASAEDVR
jgi:UDP-2-acetamido-2,6-beta-L-arabino-hexul-4-ose reductase